MTIRSFCDAAYALILREYQRAGATLTEAVEKLSQWAALEYQEQSEEARTEAMIARQNEESLRQLQAMMGGLA